VILLDSNVLLELKKELPEAAVERWFLMHEEESHIPSIAIGELAFGVAKLEAGLRKSQPLQESVLAFLRPAIPRTSKPHRADNHQASSPGGSA
jgi:predicted nucleic acid-binding protein